MKKLNQYSVFVYKKHPNSIGFLRSPGTCQLLKCSLNSIEPKQLIRMYFVDVKSPFQFCSSCNNLHGCCLPSIMCFRDKPLSVSALQKKSKALKITLTGHFFAVILYHVTSPKTLSNTCFRFVETTQQQIGFTQMILWTFTRHLN